MNNKINKDFRGLALFKSVINLKWAKGKFPSLRAESFDGLINLMELDLKNNSIRYIVENTFIALAKLTKLSLDENNLEIVKSNTFNGLYNLNDLSLEKNEIKHVDPYSFIGLSALTKLTLQSNKLNALRSNTFIGLTALCELNLENNQIDFIEPSSFLGLFNLKILLLGKNRLQELDETTFYGLCNLKYLDITKNTIHTIRINTFYKLLSLSHLYLIGNHFNQIDQLNKPHSLVYIDINQINNDSEQCLTKISNSNQSGEAQLSKKVPILSATKIRRNYSINHLDTFNKPFLTKRNSDQDLRNVNKLNQ
jgi:Leucine-rich repeat (LRR) protein